MTRLPYSKVLRLPAQGSEINLAALFIYFVFELIFPLL